MGDWMRQQVREAVKDALDGVRLRPMPRHDDDGELWRTLVSTIADLTTAVSQLAAAVAAVPPAVTGTQLDAADQAALDSAVTSLNAAVASLQALATPPAP